MGAVMAMEEINAEGGIAGNKLDIEFRDSTLAAPEAIQNAHYFADSWGADFLAGVDSSGAGIGPGAGGRPVGPHPYGHPCRN